MITFFSHLHRIFIVSSLSKLSNTDSSKLSWLFGGAKKVEENTIKGIFIGTKKTLLTPWSTNAVEITENMGIRRIIRIENFERIVSEKTYYDPLLESLYEGLDRHIFSSNKKPEEIIEIDNIASFNQKEGLSLSNNEVQYLEALSHKLQRKLTDSEVFGFSQINSEHCRHKIFNGRFILNDEEQKATLFEMIKETSKKNPDNIISAYTDNVAFVKGPIIEQFAPKHCNSSSYYSTKPIQSVISLKAETHNFPTTVEPFNGAATGSGGEIRDRLAGGKGSIPLAGTAVYMTSYSRLKGDKPWEKFLEKKWLYQSPLDILIKASNGASDFGNKFGQPLICGSILTFEHKEQNRELGYDKVIMQAGGIGYSSIENSLKNIPKQGDEIIILGGDNYRIGMGGAAVSSSDTGEMDNSIELNAIQRSNPEMQKRVANTIRNLVESDNNPIISIHDHGAGGHLNCLSELVEKTGGTIDLDKLPLGDPTLSAKEIIGNESQERMGLIVNPKDLENLKKTAKRECTPLYRVGKITNNNQFVFQSDKLGKKPIDLSLSDMFGNAPKTILKDSYIIRKYENLQYDDSKLFYYLDQVMKLESVGCKDWLTNKVDRCVGGKVAKQQTCGALQLPLNNVGVMALDYKGKEGIATSIGHTPIASLINEVSGTRTAIAESLSNLLFAPLEKGLASVNLSANWMWACKNEGEDTRLYNAVKAASEFAISLGIPIPTGKDSLSMKQKYPDKEVIAPGTVIISATGHCSDIQKVVEPILQTDENNTIYYINLSGDNYKLGGSAFGQILKKVGKECPNIEDTSMFKKIFNTFQSLVKEGKISAGHDISSGGLIVTLLEMCFAENNIGAELDLSSLHEKDTIKLLFSENSSIVFQSNDSTTEEILQKEGIEFHIIGKAKQSNSITLKNNTKTYTFDIEKLRDTWYETSYLLDEKQTTNGLAKIRFDNYKKQELRFIFPKGFLGKIPISISKQKPRAAIIREKGSNSEREMANAMYLAGFEVKDIHMTDLMSGAENLEDIQFIGAVGGFSNSDVLGSAKGWAGSFLYNEKAKNSLEKFFKREDTLSVGICNGCQLFVELDLINPLHSKKAKLLHNDSKKHECSFTSVRIGNNNSVMLSSLEGTILGVWISNGEGKFHLPMDENKYNIVAKYGYDNYPANPNGSDYNTAMLCSDDGRHLVMMPHIERSIFQWNWAYYPKGRKDNITPWIAAFVNAKKWLEE